MNRFLNVVTPVAFALVLGGGFLLPLGFGLYGTPGGEVENQLVEYRWGLLGLFAIGFMLLILRECFNHSSYSSPGVAACIRAADEAIQDRSHAPSNADADAVRQPAVEPITIPADYIRYFVSYNWAADPGLSGIGNTEIGRAQTIRGHTDIREMADLIIGMLKEEGFQNPKVVVLNWQPFEPPRQDDGGRETADEGMPSTVVLRLVA